MQKITYHLKHERETKGTHLYKGETSTGKQVSFYVSKDDVDGLPPRFVTLTVEPASTVEGTVG